MPNTTNFNWATPADTDLVKDGAAAIRTLGSSIDTSFVDLKGGTTGQVLAKASNTDLDFSWSSVDPLTILDAKGDLISATAADTPARLASSGINGDVLTIDTSTSTGLKWAAPTGIAPIVIDDTVNQYLGPLIQASGTSATATVAQTCYIAAYLPDCTLDRISFRTGGGTFGTYNVRLGLYNCGSDGRPSTVKFDAGTVQANAINTTYEITINQTITAGWYFFAGNCQTQVVSGTPTFLSTSATVKPLNFYSSDGPGFSPNYGFIENSITGAFATATSLSTTAGTLMIVQARISA